MNRLVMIINLLLGKDIIVYNYLNKELLMIIGSNKEVLKKRYNYAFIGKNESCLKDINGEIYYTGDDYEN